jgi:hypothetical protein
MVWCPNHSVDLSELRWRVLITFPDNVDVILARMADAGGFTATDVVALLASHSVAGADNVDPTVNKP